MNDPRLVSFLLVEDDDDHAQLCMRSLRKSKLVNEMHRARDGAEAIEYLLGEGEFANRSLPDVILLDLKLPKVSGLEVLERIRSEPALKNLLVVVLTTSSNEQDRETAYSLNANSYLVKPIDSDNFRQMLTDLSLYWGVWNQPPPPKICQKP